jgi:hypothetical protein
MTCCTNWGILKKVALPAAAVTEAAAVQLEGATFMSGELALWETNVSYYSLSELLTLFQLNFVKQSSVCVCGLFFGCECVAKCFAAPSGASFRQQRSLLLL